MWTKSEKGNDCLKFLAGGIIIVVQTEPGRYALSIRYNGSIHGIRNCQFYTLEAAKKAGEAWAEALKQDRAAFNEEVRAGRRTAE